MCLPHSKQAAAAAVALLSSDLMYFDFNVDEYLDRISFIGQRPVQPTLENLNKLICAQLYSVPFENLDLHMKGNEDEYPIKLSAERSYEKIVRRKRGGFCMELNPLFCAFLKKIGYNAYSTDYPLFHPVSHIWLYTHMASIVEIDGKFYSVDVGMGNPAVLALLLEPNLEQKADNGYVYRITKSDEEYFIERKTAQKSDKIEVKSPLATQTQTPNAELQNLDYKWLKTTKFRLHPEDLSFWSQAIKKVQTAAGGPFKRHPFVCLLSKTKRQTLADLRYIETPVPFGERKERLLSVVEYFEVLRDVFQISLDETDIIEFSSIGDDGGEYWSNVLNVPSKIKRVEPHGGGEHHDGGEPHGGEPHAGDETVLD